MNDDMEAAIAHRALEQIWELMDDYLRVLYVGAISVDLPDGYEVEVEPGDDRPGSVWIRWADGVVVYELGCGQTPGPWRLDWYWRTEDGPGQRKHMRRDDANRYPTLTEAVAATTHIHGIA